MKRTRVTNAFINYLRSINYDYQSYVNRIVLECGFNPTFIDYHRFKLGGGLLIVYGNSGQIWQMLA